MINGVRKLKVTSQFKSVFIYAALLVATTSLADDTSVELGQKEKKAELSNLRGRIHSLRDDLGGIQNRYDKIRAELRNTELKISKLLKVLRQIRSRLHAQSQKLHKLNREKQRYSADLDVQSELLTHQIYASYVIGRQEYLKLLLNQEDPAVMGRVTTYYKYFNEARSRRIDQARETLAKLEKVQQTIRKESVTLKSLQKQQQQKKKVLENTSRSRARVVALLNNDIQSKSDRLKRLLEDERELAKLINDIENKESPAIPLAVIKRGIFADKKGKLNWPVKGHVKAIFGKPRKTGKVKWNGVVIAAKQGTDVHAVSRGRVAYADWLRGYGLLIIIDHGTGYMSLYGYNQSLYKEAGDWVEADELIASVGDTGGRQISGLYFEIRHNGRPTNPLSWCRRLARG